MKYIKLFESFIAEVAGYKLVPGSSKVKGWVDQGGGSWMVNCTLGRIYVATVDTPNTSNVSVFLPANDPAIITQLKTAVKDLIVTEPPIGKPKSITLGGTTWNYEKMLTCMLTDVTTGDPILLSIANVLNKVQTANPDQPAEANKPVTNYTGLKRSTTVDPKVKELQTAIINSGNAKAALALTKVGGATGIFGIETSSAIVLLIGAPIDTVIEEITPEINKKLADKLSAGKKYAADFFGTVVDPSDPTKRINIADVISKQKTEDDAKALATAGITTTTTTKKP